MRGEGPASPCVMVEVDDRAWGRTSGWRRETGEGKDRKGARKEKEEGGGKNDKESKEKRVEIRGGERKAVEVMRRKIRLHEHSVRNEEEGERT